MTRFVSTEGRDKKTYSGGDFEVRGKVGDIVDHSECAAL